MNELFKVIAKNMGRKWGRLINTVGPRYSQTFYLQIYPLTFAKNGQNDYFLVINKLFTANSRFAVDKYRTYLPQITRENCI